MIKLFRNHPYLMAALSLASALTVMFAVRFVVVFVYWSNHRDESVRAWMTVGYVGRSWGLEPRDIDLAAGLPQPKGHPLTLNEIAQLRGVPVTEIIKIVEDTVAQLKANHP